MIYKNAFKIYFDSFREVLFVNQVTHSLKGLIADYFTIFLAVESVEQIHENSIPQSVSFILLFRSEDNVIVNGNEKIPPRDHYLALGLKDVGLNNF